MFCSRTLRQRTPIAGLPASSGASRTREVESRPRGSDTKGYLEDRSQIYAVGGNAAALTIAGVDDKGVLTQVAARPMWLGTRVVVATADGTTYVADGAQGRILALTLAP